MKRFVLVAIGSLAIALATLACGDKNEKPPLMPDSEHGDEAGAPSTPSAPAPATPPGK